MKGGSAGVRATTAVAVAIVIALAPSSAVAHGGGTIQPDGLATWRVWVPDPWVFAVTGALIIVYGRGYLTMRVPLDRALAFVAAQAILILALSPGMEAWAYTLLSAHMVQHLLLLVVSAPLLAYSRPLAPLLLGLPKGPVRRVASRLARAMQRGPRGASVTVLGTLLLASGVVWLWHVPGFYEAAIHSSSLHMLEHVLFLATAVLFWATVLPGSRGARAHNAARIPALFAMSVQGAMLGALIAFSSSLWFEHYGSTASLWGLTAADDQQMAGLVMWMIGGLVYAAVAAALLASSLTAMEERMQREAPTPTYRPLSIGREGDT